MNITGNKLSEKYLPVNSTMRVWKHQSSKLIWKQEIMSHRYVFVDYFNPLTLQYFGLICPFSETDRKTRRGSRKRFWGGYWVYFYISHIFLWKILGRKYPIFPPSGTNLYPRYRYFSHFVEVPERRGVGELTSLNKMSLLFFFHKSAKHILWLKCSPCGPIVKIFEIWHSWPHLKIFLCIFHYQTYRLIFRPKFNVDLWCISRLIVEFCCKYFCWTEKTHTLRIFMVKIFHKNVFRNFLHKFVNTFYT